MKKDYLKDEANVLRVQKHQLNNTENKIFEIDSILLNIQSKEWKKPDSRLNKEKYSPNYLNSLIQMN